MRWLLIRFGPCEGAAVLPWRDFRTTAMMVWSDRGLGVFKKLLFAPVLWIHGVLLHFPGGFPVCRVG